MVDIIRSQGNAGWAYHLVGPGGGGTYQANLETDSFRLAFLNSDFIVDPLSGSQDSYGDISPYELSENGGYYIAEHDIDHGYASNEYLSLSGGSIIEEDNKIIRTFDDFVFTPIETVEPFKTIAIIDWFTLALSGYVACYITLDARYQIDGGNPFTISNFNLYLEA